MGFKERVRALIADLYEFGLMYLRQLSQLEKFSLSGVVCEQ